MAAAEPSSGLPDRPLQADRIAQQFEQAWRQALLPSIDEHLALSAGQDDDARLELLAELVCLDLEFRWKSACTGETQPPTAVLPERFQVEDYLRRHPELRGDPEVAVDLFAEEYRVRQRWGDRPAHEEYLHRAGAEAQRLAARLADIDGELRVEREDPPEDEPPRWRLVVSGPSAGAGAHPLGPQPQMVGRAVDADVQLLHPSVSRRHCRVWLEGDACWVQDLHSTNGTFVNQQRVTRHRLEPGDVLRVGVFALQVAPAR